MKYVYVQCCCVIFCERGIDRTQPLLNVFIWFCECAENFRLKGGNTINGGWAELSVCHEVRRRRVRIICWDQPLLLQPE